MKYIEKEVVDGTSVTIGRKVQFRRDHQGKTVEKVSRVYSAEYRDHEGRRRFESLGTANKREARRLAAQIQDRLDAWDPVSAAGQRRGTGGRVPINILIDRYTAFNQSRGLAPKSLAKYGSELDKLQLFCTEEGVEFAGGFTEEVYHRYGAWLRGRTHKQRAGYAPKSVAASLTMTKQLFKWAKKQKIIPDDPVEAAALPIARARPQPCPTTEQIESMLARCKDKPGWETTHDAVAILAYTGLRVGELIRLCWQEVMLDRGALGMIRVSRGGSGEGPKDREERFVPVHPRIRPIFDALPRSDGPVLPGLRDRTLLARVKRLGREVGVQGMKTHSLRHHFVSMCASNGVPVRLCLEWVGHSSSDILNLYYHLHDHESEAAMRQLAGMQVRER